MCPYAAGTLVPPKGIFTLARSPQSQRMLSKVEQNDRGRHTGIIGGASRLPASVCQNINEKLSR